MSAQPYVTEDERWRAVRDRDEDADGHFVYVVRTTGVFSRPSCMARHARRSNVAFFALPAEARAAGYRACRRCRPEEPDLGERHAATVTRACRLIERSQPAPSLDELARTVGFSRFHFHRVFKAYTGITPHDYLAASRTAKVRQELVRAETVADAIYAAGFSSNGHFYAASDDMLGMTPSAFRSGGRGLSLRLAAGRCFLGPVLVAAADKGVCAILIGDPPAALRHQLQDLFPHATFDDTDAGFRRSVLRSLVGIPAPDPTLLPEDVYRIAFEHQVRQGLRGSVSSFVPRRAG